MSILREYTLDYLIKNKRSSIAIMAAVWIASILLCSLCALEYIMWHDGVELTIGAKGNWHGELFADTQGDRLRYVLGHPNVEEVMIKGQWTVGQIQAEDRPYLIMRDANRAYWANMPERAMILEGRVPERPGEIAVSKQWIHANPQLRIGDVLVLPVGVRMYEGKMLEPVSTEREGETFEALEEKSFTLVGVLDMTTTSTVPGYMGMGYLEYDNILPEDHLTVYMRFANPRRIFEDMPQIAEAVGYKKDEYGNYLVRYNTDLLAKYFIFPKRERISLRLQELTVPIMYLVIGALVIGVFVWIIHNAFVLSANARIKQLGMLKSLGATPKQIRRSILYEAMILSLIPIPIGLGISYGLCAVLILKINEVNSISEMNIPVQFVFGWPVILPAVLMIFITVLLSAWMPAKKIGNMLPIDAIRQGPSRKIQKTKEHPWITKIFGVVGELAFVSFSAHRKSFRTSLISLTLCFLLLSTFVNIMAITQTGDSIYYKEMEYNIKLWIQNGKPIEEEVIKEIRGIPWLESATFSNDIITTTWVTGDQASMELQEIGGLQRIVDSRKYMVLEREGRYRIWTPLISLDEESFAAYCQTIGADPEEYDDPKNPRSIVVNTTRDDINSTRRNPIQIPLLNIQVGDVQNISEKVEDRSPGAYEFPLQIGYITDQQPAMGGRFPHFTLLQIIPASVYEQIVGHFDPERVPRALYTNITIQTEEAKIPSVMDELKTICDLHYGSGDYSYWNMMEEREETEQSQKIFRMILYSIAALMAAIGISNAFATVTGSLQQRKREFAMFRSIGMSPRGVKQMLWLEAMFFSLLPVLISVPVAGACIAGLLHLHEIYWREFLPNMPLVPILIFMVLIFISIGSAYLLGAKESRLGSIVEAVRDETV